VNITADDMDRKKVLRIYEEAIEKLKTAVKKKAH
jgi:hypothetical protein